MHSRSSPPRAGRLRKRTVAGPDLQSSHIQRQAMKPEATAPTDHLSASRGPLAALRRSAAHMPDPGPTLMAACIALTAAIVVWVQMEQRYRAEQVDKLGLVTGDISTRIQVRLTAYRQVLLGARALIHASEDVSRAEWKTYVESLSLNRDYGGIQGVGYAEYVPSAARARHEALIQQQGFANYRIRPEGPRDEYTSIVFIEPFDWRNQRAFGYDMMSEAVRREAMDRARRTGEGAMSGKVTLVQETDVDVQPGVLLYVPHFDKRLRIDTEAERQAALLGWVYSPFRMHDLMRGMLGTMNASIRIRIFDNEVAAGALLYDNQPSPMLRGETIQSRLALTLDGRDWILVADAPPGFSGDNTRMRAEFAVVALIGLLFVTTTALFSNIQARAKRLSELADSLKASEDRYAQLVNLSSEGVVSLDARQHIDFANPRMHRMLGVEPGTLAGMRLAELVTDSSQEVLGVALDCLRSGRSGRWELGLRARDGSKRLVMVSASSRRDKDGTPNGAILAIADITERKAHEERVAWLATHDALTALPNRTLVIDRLNQAMSTARRHQLRFSLLFIDFDRFKIINDTHGHSVGDALLIEATHRMLGCLRATDTLARQGGDEFIALLPETRTHDDARTVAEKICAVLSEPFHIGQCALQISASIGVALYPEDGEDFDTLVGHADGAMYRAKQAGRDTVVSWSDKER